MQDKNTALVTIDPNPLADVDIQTLVVSAQKIKVYAIGMSVVDTATDAQATNDLVTIKNMKKLAKERKDEYLGPVKEAENLIKAAFDELLTPINEADLTIRGKITAYRMQEQARIEEERKLQEQEAVLAAAKGEEAPIVPIILDAPTHKTTEAGASTMKMIKKWRWGENVTLEQKRDNLPRWALKPDDVAIGQAVRSGNVSVADFKGMIEIYEEPSITVTDNK